MTSVLRWATFHSATLRRECIIILRRITSIFAARVAILALTAMVAIVTSTGCSKDGPTPLPAASAGGIEVVGVLIALEDGRPSDGGIDLTLETGKGIRELVRVPSSFIAGPRDSVLAMHQVVDAAKVGDRMRARGTRDETGALRPKVLELISEPPNR